MQEKYIIGLIVLLLGCRISSSNSDSEALDPFLQLRANLEN